MRLFLISISLLISAAAQAQYSRQRNGGGREELEQRREAILETIRETEEQLAAIKSDKKASMAELNGLRDKLAQRQHLIRNIDHEIGNIDKDIHSSSQEVQELQRSLALLQTRYAELIRYSYTNRSSYAMVAFLFSAPEFNEAVHRMQYMRRTRGYHMYQVQLIVLTQEQLGQKIGTLNAAKAEKDELLRTRGERKVARQQETAQANKVGQELKTKENKLLADIKKNRKKQDAINRSIKDLMKSHLTTEDDDGERPTRTTVKKKKTPRPELLLTPEEEELSGNFEDNKGRMYWPVEKGYIADHYGKYPHPLFPHIMVDNIGVGIQTSEDARIRCVFKGVVSKVFSPPQSSSKVVIVKHGSYCTVYNGLASVSVSVGDRVNDRQNIGRVAQNDADLPVIDFQIWKATSKGTSSMNPEQWIGKLR